MLHELRLRNLAVAEDVSVALGPGLNVLTGSTGAGKSLVGEALRWLSGAPIDRTLLREGAERASAECVFDVRRDERTARRLEELGIDCDDDGFLVLRREIGREGRSRALVNGAIASAALLAKIHAVLFEVQSQHEQLVLLDPASHAALLDGVETDPGPESRWREAYESWRQVEREVAAARERARQLRDERDLLEFQRRELREAQLRDGELEELRRTVARLEGGARLLESAHAAAQRLDDDEAGARTRVAEALHELHRLPEELEELAEAREQLENAADLLAEASRALSSFLGDEDYDPEQLEGAQQRLAFLLDLTRKYGRTEAELILRLEQLEEQLGSIEAGEEIPAALARAQESARGELQAAAEERLKRWKKVARGLERESAPLLEELGMVGARLRFDFEPEVDPEGPIVLGGRRVRPRRSGPVRVRLSVRTNPGERFGPIENVASGGELSRIGLVLRSLGRAGRESGLLVLDEVDAGLGADLGPALARRLRALSDRGQVLVITHLPAVAAAADLHLVARKTTRSGRTSSEIERVEGEERIVELTRMIGAHGEDDRRAAEALLAAGRSLAERSS